MKPSEFLTGVSPWLTSQVAELYDYGEGSFLIGEETVFAAYDAQVRMSLECPRAQNISGSAGGNMRSFLNKYGIFVDTPVTGEVVLSGKPPIIKTTSETLAQLDALAEENQVAGGYLYASFQSRKSDPSRFLVSRDLVRCTAVGNEEYRGLVDMQLEQAVKEFALITERS